VDLKDEVNRYHESFFKCPNFSFEKKDITTVFNSKNRVIYANFCGITESIRGIAHKVETANPGYMVSFSTARKAKVLEESYIQLLVIAARKNKKQVHFGLVNNRGDFITLKLVAKEKGLLFDWCTETKRNVTQKKKWC